MDIVASSVFERFAKELPYHEAGHAMIGRACGRTLEKITTKPDAHGILGCYFLKTEKVSNEANIATKIAGPLAQLIACHGSLGEMEKLFSPTLFSHIDQVTEADLEFIGWHSDLANLFETLKKFRERQWWIDNITVFEKPVTTYFQQPPIFAALQNLGKVLENVDSLDGDDAEGYLRAAIDEVEAITPKLQEAIRAGRESKRHLLSDIYGSS